MTPLFPIISIYNSSVEVFQKDSMLSRATILAVLNEKMNSRVFDPNGNCWTLQLKSNKVKHNLITRFLANTLYNPIIDVTQEWTLIGTYEIPELKSELINIINQDDDLLTQFVEPDILISAIIESKSVLDIINALNKNIFEYSEDNLNDK